MWICVDFQQKDWQDPQNLNNETFYRPPLTIAQCNIGWEKYPHAGILLKYDDVDYSQGFVQIEEAIGALTKDYILSPCKSDQGFRSIIVNDAGEDEDTVDYILYVFDIRYQKTLEPAQPIKIEFIDSEDVSVGILGFALVLTNKLVSVSSDGQRHFDLI